MASVSQSTRQCSIRENLEFFQIFREQTMFSGIEIVAFLGVIDISLIHTLRQKQASRSACLKTFHLVNRLYLTLLSISQCSLW